MVINGFGAVLTAIVMLVFAVTKFQDGAWVVVILIPVLVLSSAPSIVTIGSWPPASRSSSMARRPASTATG